MLLTSFQNIHEIINNIKKIHFVVFMKYVLTKIMVHVRRDSYRYYLINERYNLL